MPIANIEQPDILQLSDKFRLRKYDGNYEQALVGYQDPTVYQNSEGIFDSQKIPDLDYVKGMFEYLDSQGEVYFIDALETNGWRAIGDVTVKDQNPPIAIWEDRYRGKGLGTLVMQAVITRLRELGYSQITETIIYEWNTASIKLHETLGFRVVKKDGRDLIYELKL